MPSIKNLPTRFAGIAFFSITAITAFAASEDGPAFLTARTKAITDTGIIGVPAGTKVNVISQSKDTVKVKIADGTEFEVPAAQITRDEAQAAAIAQSAAAAEADAKAKRDALIAAENAKKAAIISQLQDAMQNATASTALASGTTQAGTGTSGLQGSSLDAGGVPANVTMHEREKEDQNKNNRGGGRRGGRGRRR